MQDDLTRGAVRGIGSQVGSQLTREFLNTPQGHAAVIGTVATAITVAPVVAFAAITGACIYGGIKLADAIDKHL